MQGSAQILRGCCIPGGWGISPQMSRPPFFLPLLCITQPHPLNGIKTIGADTLLQFPFRSGLILPPWWAVTPHLLHTAPAAVSGGLWLGQGTACDARCHTHTDAINLFPPWLPLPTACAYIHTYISACECTRIFYYQNKQLSCWMLLFFSGRNNSAPSLLAPTFLFVYFIGYYYYIKSAQNSTRHKVQIISAKPKQNRQRRQDSLRSTEEWRLALFHFL